PPNLLISHYFQLASSSKNKLSKLVIRCSARLRSSAGQGSRFHGDVKRSPPSLQAPYLYSQSVCLSSKTQAQLRFAVVIHTAQQVVTAVQIQRFLNGLPEFDL